MNVQYETLIYRLESLGLNFMAAGLESFLSETHRQDQTLVNVIADLIEIEYIPRKERSTKSRLKLSGMPVLKRLEDFDRLWLKGGITERQFEELSSLSFLERKENIIFMGPSGLGKTHLMLALGHKACLDGFTSYYTTCIDLIENLVKARENKRLKSKLMWLRKPHLLLVDEVGYETLSPEQANLFFQVVNLHLWRAAYHFPALCPAAGKGRGQGEPSDRLPRRDLCRQYPTLRQLHL
jgi:DNA replication protein DnaC